MLRVLSRPRFESGEFIEVVLREAPLKRAMVEFAKRFLWLSTLILMAAGALIYGSLTFAFVRPMREIDGGDRAIPRQARGRVDRLPAQSRAAMRSAAPNAPPPTWPSRCAIALRQNERLAALGAAVARIGHDLRNMLSTAQLVADRLQHSEDQNVRRLSPRLERTIDARFGAGGEHAEIRPRRRTHAGIAACRCRRRCGRSC